MFRGYKRMEQITYMVSDEALTIKPAARMDAANAPETEKEILEVCTGVPGLPIVIDAEKLEYISSAGLRVLLHLRKVKKTLTMINVSPEVYEILDITGFTEMLTVKRAYRSFSVDGCEIIGKGANGAVYRYDAETIIKVYFNPDALPEIQRERELARKALVLGINTAIPYDVVRIGERYGTVMELLEAEPLSRLIIRDPEHLELPLKYLTDMIKQLHSTEIKPGDLPNMKETALGWAEFDKKYLPEETGERLYGLVKEIPDRNTMLHGDCHTNNIMVRDGEALLIDMDTLCMGHPVFELGSMYNAFVAFGESDRRTITDFFGFSPETAKTFWRRALASYLGTEEEKKLDEVEAKAKVIGYMRLLRRTVRRNTPERERLIQYYKEQLVKLVPTVGRLTYESGNEDKF